MKNLRSKISETFFNISETSSQTLAYRTNSSEGRLQNTAINKENSLNDNEDDLRVVYGNVPF